MSEMNQLKDRVAARRKELEAKLHTLRADTRQKASEEATEIEAKLEQMKEAVKDGWDRLSEASSKKLNKLLS